MYLATGTAKLQLKDRPGVILPLPLVTVGGLKKIIATFFREQYTRTSVVLTRLCRTSC